MTTYPFRWLPNFFTVLRLVLAPLILVAAWQDAWAAAFWIMVIALLTDFLDGWAALAFHAQTSLGEKLDPIADALLAAIGLCAVIVGGDLPPWLAVAALPPALYIGYVKFVVPQVSKLHRLQPMITAPMLFAVWTLEAWYYATRAWGWSWIYVAVTVILLVAMAIPKQHRLRVWFAWLFKSQS